MNQNFKNRTSQPRHPEQSTRALLRQAARDAIGTANVHLEVDAPAAVRCPVDPDRLIELVTAMVRGALDSLPAGGEITLTLWQTESTCELEVADSGPAIELRPRRLPVAAASLDAEMTWQNCPQGGAAVTAKFRPVHAVREAA